RGEQDRCRPQELSLIPPPKLLLQLPSGGESIEEWEAPALKLAKHKLRGSGRVALHWPPCVLIGHEDPQACLDGRPAVRRLESFRAGSRIGPVEHLEDL